MEVFSCLFAFGFSCFSNDDEKLDILSELPLEIAIMILRMLDGASLLNVQRVSKWWFKICQSDRILKQKIRQHRKAEKEKQNEFLFGRIGGKHIVPKDESSAFGNKSKNMKREHVQPSTSTMGQTFTQKKTPAKFSLLETIENINLKSSRKRKRNEVKGIGNEQKRRLRRL